MQKSPQFFNQSEQALRHDSNKYVNIKWYSKQWLWRYMYITSMGQQNTNIGPTNWYLYWRPKQKEREEGVGLAHIYTPKNIQPIFFLHT